MDAPGNGWERLPRLTCADCVSAFNENEFFVRRGWNPGARLLAAPAASHIYSDLYEATENELNLMLRYVRRRQFFICQSYDWQLYRIDDLNSWWLEHGR